MNNLKRAAFALTVLPLTILLLAVGATLAAPLVSPRGYSFVPAPGWQVNRSGLMGTDVAVLGPPAAGFRPNLNVVIAPAQPGQTLQAGREQIAALYPRAFPQFKMLSSGVRPLNGVPALNVLCTYQREGRLLRMRQAVFLRAGHVYTFTYTVPDAAHARYDAVGERMLRSVRWAK